MENRMTTPKIGLMLDIETLGKRHDAMVTQIALVPWLLDQPNQEYLPPVQIFLPLAPQELLIPPRVIDSSTVLYWMKQDDAARSRFGENESTDMEELKAYLQNLVFRFMRFVGNEEYELWARGPQFDVVIVESLLAQFGLTVPWNYTKVRDLRTLMSAAGLSTSDVPRPSHMIEHVAVHDCAYQIMCYESAMAKLNGDEPPVAVASQTHPSEFGVKPPSLGL
jgi:hypothetical protein